MILLFFSGSLFAVDRRAPDIVVYGAKFTDTSLGAILFDQDTSYRNSYLYVGALNLPLDSRVGPFRFETEGQVGAHFGLMKHMEFNGLLIARWDAPYVPLSFGLGEGLSLASSKPRLEIEWDNFLHLRMTQDTSPLLNYLMMEMDMAVPGLDFAKNLRVFMRIHHRSGAFGTYCQPTCGSNFIAYGLKVAL